MSDVLAAAFLAVGVAWAANRWASGGFSDANLPGMVGTSSPDKRETEHQSSFGAWATKALSEFAEIEREALRGETTSEDLRKLYAARGAILENFYARQRFAPNDDAVLSGMERETKDADIYMTTAINNARSKNASLRFVRYPLSCGDGDARFPVTS